MDYYWWISVWPVEQLTDLRSGMMARCFYPETTFSYNIERLHFVLTVNLQVTTASRIGSIMLSSAYKIKDEVSWPYRGAG